jgi:RNA polymerase sigma factor (sigma-70 family)
MAALSVENPRLEAISTRWTLLRQAHGESEEAAAGARRELVLRYLPAVRRYVGAMVRKDDEAEDITQDVVMRLMNGDFAGADPSRGRFRDFLKMAIRNMVRSHWGRLKRRRVVDLGVETLQGPDDNAREAVWLSSWREGVLELVWKAMEQHARNRPGSIGYTLLKLRADCPDDSSEQLAERLSEKLGRPVRADALRQALRRARLQFADLLITEIAKGLEGPTPEKIEEELAALGLLEYMRDLLPTESS